MPKDFSSDLRIMVVNDDEGMLELLLGVLHQIGYHDLASHIGADEAWHDLPRFQPDLMIVEDRMERDGAFDLARWIRAGDETIPRDIPIILLVSQPRTEQIRAALDAGVDQVLVKPITAKALSERIGALAAAPPRTHIQDCA